MNDLIMNDLISRQQTIEAFETAAKSGASIEDIKWIFKNLPSIHETGWWIEHKNADIVDGHYISMYECSCCHVWKHNNGDYCPYCGMKMYGTIMEGNE